MKIKLGHLVLRVSQVHRVSLTGVTSDISEKHVSSGLLAILSGMSIDLTHQRKASHHGIFKLLA